MPATPAKRSSTPIEWYQFANSSWFMSGWEPSSVRAASVRSSIRRTAVVTDAPTDAARASNAWSFWRLTWPRQSRAVRPASTMNTASSSHATHVRDPLVLIAVRCVIGPLRVFGPRASRLIRLSVQGLEAGPHRGERRLRAGAQLGQQVAAVERGDGRLLHELGEHGGGRLGPAVLGAGHDREQRRRVLGRQPARVR